MNEDKKHVVSIPIASLIALIGLIAGSFVSPLFGDRMNVEHRLSKLEEIATNLKSMRDEDDRETERFRIEINAKLSSIEDKINQWK